MIKQTIGLKCIDCYYFKKDKTKEKGEQCINCPYKVRK